MVDLASEARRSSAASTSSPEKNGGGSCTAGHGAGIITTEYDNNGNATEKLSACWCAEFVSVSESHFANNDFIIIDFSVGLFCSSFSRIQMESTTRKIKNTVFDASTKRVCTVVPEGNRALHGLCSHKCFMLYSHEYQILL